MDDDDRESGDPTTDGVDEASDAGTDHAIDAGEVSELEPGPWAEHLEKAAGLNPGAADGSAKEGPRVGPGAVVALSNASPPRGHVSQRFVGLAAEEVVALLRETVAPNLWKPVLARAGEILDAEG